MEITQPVSLILNNKPSDLWIAKPTDTVFDSIKQMSDKNVGALPVMDGDTLLGIISERDYTRRVILEGKSSHDTRVEQIMTSDVVTINSGETVESAMQLMTKKRVRHLPVVDDEKLTGMLSIGDLVKWTMSAQGAMIEQLEGYITGGGGYS